MSKSSPSAAAAGDPPAHSSGGQRTSPPPPEATPQAHSDFIKQVRLYFKRRFDLAKENGGHKPDMTAWGDCKKAFDIPRRHGHIPGVNVGDIFSGRGEAAAVGVHMMMQRIDYANNSDDGSHSKGAYAVCLGGGYCDDEDNGEVVTYTGMGGQSGKLQVRDQEMTKGNLALRCNFETGTPVRLIRGKRDGFTHFVTYVYDGLYNVVEYTFEPSVATTKGADAVDDTTNTENGENGKYKGPPRVFKFKLVAVKGESNVSFLAPSFKRIGLRYMEKFVNTRIDKTTNRRKEIPAAAEDQGMEGAAESRAPSHPDSANVLVHDLSKGANHTPYASSTTRRRRSCGFQASQRSVHVRRNVSSGRRSGTFTRAHLARAREAISEVAARKRQMDEKREDSHRRAFGKQFVNAVPSRRAYSLDGLLKQSSEEGLVETWDDGDAKHARAATGGDAGMTFHVHNESTFTARSIHPGLEVYKVSEEKGWGLRCRQRILAGAYVCDSVGEVCRDSERDEDSPELLSDEYITALDHYHPPTKKTPLDALEGSAAAANATTSDPPSTPTKQTVLDTLEDYLLCLDAYQYGNVARYINTSKGRTNLILQPIFTRTDSKQASSAPDPSSMQFYRIALFATRDIEPLEELLYDYGGEYWGRLKSLKGSVRVTKGE
ncbi:histone-lysine N-methyltransferase [Pseudoscourfieldia marina]